MRRTEIALMGVALMTLSTACGNSTVTSISSEPTVEESSTTETTSIEINAESTADIESSVIMPDESTTAEITEELITEMNKDSEEDDGILKSADDLGLYDIDGENVSFAFTYGDETFYAYYTPENWKIVDSYKINSMADMLIICQALIDIHPLHGNDGESYRTPKDMAYEWIQHNIAYKLLPDNDPWKYNAKDVDLNPADQGKSIYEMYKAKTGGELIK